MLISSNVTVDTSGVSNVTSIVLRGHTRIVANIQRCVNAFKNPEIIINLEVLVVLNFEVIGVYLLSDCIHSVDMHRS